MEKDAAALHGHKAFFYEHQVSKLQNPEEMLLLNAQGQFISFLSWSICEMSLRKKQLNMQMFKPL